MNKITQLVFGIIVVSLLTFIAGNLLKDKNLGSSANYNFFYAPTNSSSTVSTSSKEITDRNSDRLYLGLVNDGGNIVYLSLSEDEIASSTVNYGIRLNASGGSYEINQNNLYRGAIQAITGSGTSTLTIVEK